MRKVATMLAVMLVTGAVTVQAEPMRPLLTLENRILAPGNLEVGSTFEYRELRYLGPFAMDEGTSYVLKPYVRYGALPDFELVAALPLARFEPDFGSNETDIGNLELGFRLRAYEDIFRFPSVIPHATLKLPTGGDDIGIHGSGDTSVELGLNLGPRTTVLDKLVWNLDLTYEIFEDEDNIAAAAASLIWELSDRFAFLFETRFENRKRSPDRDRPILLAAGMHYQATEALGFTVHGGAGTGSQEDVLVVFKTSLSF